LRAENRFSVRTIGNKIVICGDIRRLAVCKPVFRSKYVYVCTICAYDKLILKNLFFMRLFCVIIKGGEWIEPFLCGGIDMTFWEILSTSVLVLFDIALIVLVMLQPGKSAGLSGAIAGGAETFFGKSKARSIEGKLEKWTKILAVIFFVFAIAIVLFIF